MIFFVDIDAYNAFFVCRVWLKCIKRRKTQSFPKASVLSSFIDLFRIQTKGGKYAQGDEEVSFVKKNLGQCATETALEL